VKIVRIIARLNVGGPALHVILLSSRLRAAGHETILVKGTEAPSEGDLLHLARELDVRPVVVPQLGREIRWWDDVVAFWKLLVLIRRERPDVVHTHTAKAGMLGRVAAWLAGVPLVVHTFHGHVFHGYFSPLRTRVFVAIERWLARRTHRLVAVSARVRDEVLAHGVGRPERFHVVPVGLDLRRFAECDPQRGELRAELGLSPEAPLVGIVARLVPIKRHEVFLAAAAAVLRQRPACRFVVVGDGERRRALEEQARDLGIAEGVLFLGWRRDLERIYADLDLAVLTSANEGSPVSLIEAMAAGVAGVGPRVGGVPDVIDDGTTGVIVPPGDAAAVAGTIVRLLADVELRQKMGAAARERALRRYGADRLVADIAALYRGAAC
jgi:glycosyltransferase involved in cell wall biosynthesis